MPDHQLTGFLLRGRATPTARQLGEVGVRADRLSEVTCAEFLAEIERERYDVVVLALVGGAVQAVLHGARALWPAPARRPVLVTGYVGVVYEKLADGLLLRHGADLVLANSRHDAERFRAVYEGVGADATAVTETALPFLGGAPYEPAGSRAHTVVFAVQPSVPDSRADRAYLLERAAGHARLHPDREVLIKLRSKPGEHTTHLEEQPYQRLAEKIPGGLPANCRLVYGNMGEVLDGTDLLVTVSSTAALESLHRSVPTAILTDLGIREALGNHHFLGSGCLASWDQIDPAPPGGGPGLAGGPGRPARAGRRPGGGRGRLRRGPGQGGRTGVRDPAALARPVLHAHHRPRIPPRDPRPPPPRARRHPAARHGAPGGGGVPAAPPAPRAPARGRPRRLPARGAARGPGDPQAGGAVRVLAVVPARGGSKGVPGKNLAEVAGTPLVARAVLACRAAPTVTDVVVSTDSEAIAAAARAAGADVIARPTAISGDTASSEAAVLHALAAFEELHSLTVDVVLLVQCTSPFLATSDVESVAVAVASGAADSALTVAPFHGFLWRDAADGTGTGVNHDAAYRPRRQDRPQDLLETGAAYAMDAAGFRTARHRFFGRTLPVATDPARVLEIDDPHDLARARLLAPLLDPRPGAHPAQPAPDPGAPPPRTPIHSPHPAHPRTEGRPLP